eukprot:gene748-4490_t
MEEGLLPKTVFTGHKVSAVAWLRGVKSRSLVSGSWDNAHNGLVLWDVASTGIDGADAVPEPEKRDQIEMPNGVTSLAALGAAKVVAGCVDGSVHIFSAEGGQLERLAVFRPGRLHRVGCACTAVSKWPADDNSFVTAGEDGRANVVRIGEDSPWWSSSSSGSLGGQSRPSINGVAAYAGLVWTVNSGGQLQSWDPNSDGASPSTYRFVLDSGADVVAHELHSIDISSAGMIACGTNTGAVQIWDSKKLKYPEKYVEPHTAEVWAVKYHPTLASHMFSASENGQLLHWFTEEGYADPTVVDILADKDCLGVNCCDVEDELVACGTDRETLTIFSPMFPRD